MESIEAEDGCPSCGVLSGRVKDRPVSKVKDLPHGAVPLRVQVRKRRFLCLERLCERGSFTQSCAQLRPRFRLTGRLRIKVSAAVTAALRSMDDLVRRPGPDRPRWDLGAYPRTFRKLSGDLDGVADQRVSRWSPSGGDRSVGAVCRGDPPGSMALLARRTQVVGQPCPDLLPQPTEHRRVPHRHLAGRWRCIVQRLTDRAAVHRMAIRQRPNRQAFLALVPTDSFEHLHPRFSFHLYTPVIVLVDITKRRDRQSGVEPNQAITTAPNGARSKCHSQTRLATTIMKWWLEIEGFLELGITNARTEGHNRVIKQIKRVDCGFRSQANYERRIMLHSATAKAA